MLTTVSVFKNNDFGEIRGVSIENSPWLVGNDIAEKLGYVRTTKAINDNVDVDDKLLLNSETQSLYGIEFDYKQLGQRGGWLINESGFYSLVFASKLPKAKEFKHWVTSEVLPQIRKTGGYIPVKEEDDEKIILAKAVGIYEKTISEKDNIISQLVPKAQSYNDFISSNGAFSLLEASHMIYDGKRNKMNDFLREQGILHNDHGSPLPYGKYKKSQYFITKGGVGRNGYAYCTTYITPKGIGFIHKLLQKQNASEVL